MVLAYFTFFDKQFYSAPHSFPVEICPYVLKGFMVPLVKSTMVLLYNDWDECQIFREINVIFIEQNPIFVMPWS